MFKSRVLCMRNSCAVCSTHVLCAICMFCVEYSCAVCTVHVLCGILMCCVHCACSVWNTHVLCALCMFCVHCACSVHEELKHCAQNACSYIARALIRRATPVFQCHSDATTNNKGSRVKFSHNQYGPYVFLKPKVNFTENTVVNI